MDRMTEVFLDAAYAIALLPPTDQYHERAKLLAAQLEARNSLQRMLFSWKSAMHWPNNATESQQLHC